MTYAPTLPTVPGTVLTLHDLETGEEADVAAILGHGECLTIQRAGIVPGMAIRCVERTADHVTVETPEGRLVQLPRPFTRYVQLVRDVRRPPRAMAPAV